MKKNILSVFNRKMVVGLYIGQKTVDLVVFKAALKGPRLIKFGRTYIYPKERDEEIIPQPTRAGAPSEDKAQKDTEKKTKDDYIVEAIQRVFKENNMKPGNVVTAVSSEETMVRYFQMPKIPKKEQRQAILFEAKRYIPFRMEDVASDFMIMPGKDSPDTMDVIFVAVKQNVIKRFVGLIEKAGLNPIIIESAPFSLMRALATAGQINDTINTAIVNIDTTSANINILRKAVPYIIRDIPLDEGVSEGKSLEPIFEKLLAEIKLSFDFYEKQFPSESIDKIIIYSQLPLENWHELVGKELQIPVDLGDPLRGIRIKKDIVPPKLAVSFGLALRGISKKFIDINLYKEKILVYKRKELFLKMLFLEASAAVFLLIVLKIVCMKGIAPLTKELKRTLSERPKVEVSIKEKDIDQLERIKNKIETRKILMENIISHRTYFAPRLMDLQRILPGNIWLTEIDFEEKLDGKNTAKVLRHLNIKGYCVMDARIAETEIDGQEAASFEILFTGP